ncbi:MAG: hypothetical protein K9M97_11485, partial [Akkermansiaceae bacterium]|nr:hypothetical protein [Akkermansiaceae bacterium]
RPADYNYDPPQPIFFSPGTVTQSIFVLVNDDSLVESAETLVITVSNPVNAVLDAFTTHTHTILDNDSGGTVSIAAIDASASETGLDTGTFRISRSGPASADLTANFQVVGTASSPSDFVPLGHSVLIPAGQSFVDLVVTPVDDTTPEAAETVTLTLTSAPGATIGTSESATIVLDADNDHPAGTLAIAQATGLTSAGPGGGPFSPATGTYTLSNIADTSLDWEASTDAPWIDLSASSGTLAPGASVEVVVTLNAQAETLLPQTYSTTVAFTNTTHPNGNTSWKVNLTVFPPPQVPNQISLTNDEVVLRFWGIPGTTYQIERSPDLKTWTPLASKTAAANGFIEFTDSSPPEWRGFYRIAPP